MAGSAFLNKKTKAYDKNTTVQVTHLRKHNNG